MSKSTTRNNINEIKKIASKMPKTLAEALNFNEEEYDDVEMMDAEEPIQEPAPREEGMDVMKFVDDIRKQALRGMAQLADNPEDERYQILKKIWQICDKKPEQNPQQPMNNNI